MKTHRLASLGSLSAIGADTVIDVRAPSEYAQDHIAGAINLPVLTDEERNRVGTVYTQESPFLARKIGAALVAQNAARHLMGPLADMPGDWQPLIYCWRGGQRSGAFATILDQVGWRVHLVEGGYRSYRRLVSAQLYDRELPHRIMLVEGGTGTGKTALLQHLREAGAQVLDLEALAGHRGSIFGALVTDQPSQKMFESGLAAALDALDPERITWVESESSRIGQRIVPPALWSLMCMAPRIELCAPRAARAAFLVEAYADLVADTAGIGRNIDQLSPFHAAPTIARWHALARERHWRSLAEELISEHYDPRYAKSQARADATAVPVGLEALDAETLARTARDMVLRFT